MKINHLNDWIQLVRMARTEHRFTAEKMEMDNVYDFAFLGKKGGPFYVKKVDLTGKKYLWMPIQWLQYRNGEVKMHFKTTLEENTNFWQSVNLKLIGPVTISQEKKKDILHLLPLIDSAFHDFSKNLKTNNLEPLDLDLVEINPDEED
ncbi:unnamed protein product [Hermetia illucens]|uniref:Uncharacterized protein n=1 Tax=Hermetia illucens TaxID=343691 RepID=A0A7R8YRB8_HERIL|nr:unnamed protein product [Hermetia illucens]